MKNQVNKSFTLGLILLTFVQLKIQAQWTKAGNIVYNTVLTDSVGIGTSTPKAKCDIKGSFRVAPSTAVWFKIYKTGSGLGLLEYSDSSSLYVPTSRFIIRQSLSQEGLYYNQPQTQYEWKNPTFDTKAFINIYNGNTFFAGKVGIGVLSPNNKLDVIDTSASCSARIKGKPNSNLILEKQDSSKVAALYFTSNGAPQWNIGTYLSDHFTIRNATNGSYAMFIEKSTNNVGVGTGYPTATLNVRGLNWDLTNSEGDFKIGDDLYRLKMGVATGGGGAGDARIRAHGGTNRLMLGTGVTDYLTIDNIGRIGIGTTTPASKLDLFGNARLNSSVGASRSLEFFYPGTSVSQNDFRFTHNGTYLNVEGSTDDFTSTCNLARFNICNSTYSFTVFGGALASGGTWTNSDFRYKTNIQPIQHALTEIMKIEGVTYNYKVDEFPQWNFDMTRQIGVIAQDVEKVFPELVKTDADGYKAVSYEKFVPVLVEAIKEQQNEIENKNLDLHNMSDAFEKMKSDNESLKSRIDVMEISLSQCCNKSDIKNSDSKQKMEVDKTLLFQNQPNPFNQTTVIRYQLAVDVREAKIIIRNLNGELMKSISINGNGKNQVVINANEFVQGTYTYSLIVNDETIDTKLMVITK